MKLKFLTTVISLTTAVSLFADDATSVTNGLADDKSRLSYAIGMMFASRWKEQGVDVDNNMVLRGLNDEQSGKPTLMSEQEEHDIITRFQQDLANKAQQMRAEMTAKNKAEGEAFLAQNKSQPGVVALADGLQYKVITEGTGETPSPTDTVTVKYRGTFLNGTEFDSSEKHGGTAQFPVNHVIRGWTEALTLMRVGSKWQVFIPSDLAYGPNGYGGRIEPNMTLIFEVELVSIQHPQAQALPAPAPVQPLTSDIIKVQGTNVEFLKPEDVQRLQQAQQGK